jgi:hypothetical protein
VITYGVRDGLDNGNSGWWRERDTGSIIDVVTDPARHQELQKRRVPKAQLHTRA